MKDKAQAVRKTDPSFDALLLTRIETLIHKVKGMKAAAKSEKEQESSEYALLCMAALGDAVLKNKPIFGTEAWHVIDAQVPLSRPGEYLLRLKDSRKGADGKHLPPYPAIMTFYKNGMTSDIDAVLVMCALHQFMRSDEMQVSVNISARSLQNAGFIKDILERIESADLKPDQRLIFEIHETTPELKMSKDVLKMFRKAGVMFALDDVGLSMADILRMSEFDDFADFIKLDRKSVCAAPEKPYALDHLVSLVVSLFPNATLVAEGVKTAAHAKEIKTYHPAIKYVQGLYLTQDRDAFQKDWRELQKS